MTEVALKGRTAAYFDPDQTTPRPVAVTSATPERELETPRFPPAESVSATFTATQDLEPEWAGRRVKIEDLPDFKDRWGLVTVGSDWPEGEPLPEGVPDLR